MRPAGHANNFKVDIDPITTKIDNLYVESCRAAEELYSMREGKFHILYSGGIDSEHCLSVFLSLGMEVTPVIIKFKQGYNDHDTKFAFDFCQEKNLTPVIIDINYDDFIESGKLLQVTQEMNASTFGRAHVAYAAGLLDGTVLLGDGESYIKLNSDDNVWYVELDEHDFSIYNYFKKYNIHGTTQFTRWTQGMNAAYINDPMMLELANNQHPGKLSSNSSRPAIYNRYSNFNLKPRHKFHGFEFRNRYPIFNHPAFAEIKEFGLAYNGQVSIPYHDFLKQYIHHDE